jgi:hypothetical protein
MRRISLAMLVVCLMASPVFATNAKWTVMVWMNGDNDLEDSVYADYQEMAKIGSSADVKIVTQFDRLAVRRNPLTDPEWADTYRFLVELNKSPVPANAVASLGEVNMVDGKALGEFVKWVMDNDAYKADHYALIFDSHGDGFRRFDPLEVPTAPDPPQFLPRGVYDAPQRAISTDDTTGPKDRLFVGEIVEGLHTAIGSRKLDLIGFDACLMGMVEVAYAFKDTAGMMVASEEKEHGTGWCYEKWLGPLVATPGIDAAGLAKDIQSAYAAFQLKRQDESRTLSSVDLTKLQALTDAINAVSKALDGDIEKHRAAVEAARKECTYMSLNGCGGRSCFFNIDLGHFMSLLAAKTKDPDLKAKAQSVVAAINQVLVTPPYAGRERGAATGFGASGLAIYFPESAKHMLNDALIGGAYSKNAMVDYPVAFVKDVEWSTFLHKLYGIPE